jgi:2'-deoxynucleoside 5'-phosphate N-hydrolase
MVQLEPEDLMRRTLQAIDVSDVVLLEFSEKGVGLGIEAGYAYAKGEPVVVVAKQGADISTTLRGISQKILFYSSREELADLVKLIAEGL